MAANSTMLALGTPAPFFALPEPVTGATIAVDGFSAPALLVMFICNHCPYVMHVRAGLVQLRADYSPADLAMVAISANDPESHPGDAPERIAEEVDAQGYRFPYLFDESQRDGPGLHRRLHSRLLPLRYRSSPGLPGPPRRQPPGAARSP